MKNKVQLKKALIMSVITIIILTGIFGIISFYQYQAYTKNFNNTINKIVEKVITEYPNIKKVQLMEILNSKGQNNHILREYGIDIEKDSIVSQNETLFLKYLIINLVLFLILAFLLITIFLIYNFSKDKKLQEITKYLEEINHKNYQLDIEDNTEDELSILKNELYKTTVMLKEIAENSFQDKINLKDSLSDISHQLKTPLTSITIMLDNILENPNMEVAIRNDFIKGMKREITNINFLVNNLLKLSKFDSDTIDFNSKEERVQTILEEAEKRWKEFVI